MSRAKPSAGKLLAGRERPGSCEHRRQNNAGRPEAVLLSDFHKADQRPSVVKKRAYATAPRARSSPRQSVSLLSPSRPSPFLSLSSRIFLCLPMKRTHSLFLSVSPLYLRFFLFEVHTRLSEHTLVFRLPRGHPLYKSLLFRERVLPAVCLKMHAARHE